VAALLCLAACIESPGRPSHERAETSREQPQPRVATAASNGFNDNIAWRELGDGLAEAKDHQRPLMVVVHASWCQSCKALKRSFLDAELRDLSDNFVMVNLDQDREPRSAEFAPDGNYVPRIVFVDPRTGDPDPSILNQRRSDKRYYYGPYDDLVGAMKKALARHGET
jgi:thiol:disulfide interchange protein